MIDTDEYEEMTYDNSTTSGIELEIAVQDLLAEVERLRKENEYLRESDWEYSYLWAWLHENTDLPKTIEPILLSKWKSEWVKKSKEADE